MFLRMFKHLLPNAKAWRITIDKKLRQFFEGLSGIGEDVKTFVDNVWSDIFPQTTRELSAWEDQFALQNNTSLTEQQRRDRLDAAWKALGGQDPRYIQDTLQANGFDVYLHSWWVEGTQPGPGVKQCVTPRNPLLVLRPSQDQTEFQVTCGNPAATCGNPAATCGSTLEPLGYPLVNKINVLSTVPKFIVTCGNPVATCGNPAATCGNYTALQEIPKNYIIPTDPAKWPYFLYIGGSVFGTLATVDALRKDEFETLCLKICPAQQWLGILVKYS